MCSVYCIVRGNYQWKKYNFKILSLGSIARKISKNIVPFHDTVFKILVGYGMSTFLDKNGDELEKALPPSVQTCWLGTQT